MDQTLAIEVTFTDCEGHLQVQLSDQFVAQSYNRSESVAGSFLHLAKKSQREPFGHRFENFSPSAVVITTNLSFSEWSSVFGDAKIITAFMDRLTHHCHIVETGNESYRFQHGGEVAHPSHWSRSVRGKETAI